MAEIRRKAIEIARGGETLAPQAPKVSLDLYRDSYANNFREWKRTIGLDGIWEAWWSSQGLPAPPVQPTEDQRHVQGVLLGQAVGMVVPWWR